MKRTLLLTTTIILTAMIGMSGCKEKPNSSIKWSETVGPMNYTSYGYAQITQDTIYFNPIINYSELK